MSSAVRMGEWIDPLEIRFKIAPCNDLSGSVDGDWDIERRYPLEDTVKYRAIVDRYRNGRRWEDTELFKDIYRRRFADGESVRGERDMKGLVAQYYDRVDGMFESLRIEGFKRDWPLPKLLKGRDGIFIGNQGNHRLAMAHVLKLHRIAGDIVCRHPLA